MMASATLLGSRNASQLAASRRQAQVVSVGRPPCLPPRSSAMALGRARPLLRPICSAGVAHPGEEEARQHGNWRRSELPIFLSVPSVTVAKKGGGGPSDMGSNSSFGGAATLERSKSDFVMPSPVVQGPKLDDSGSGGDIGKNNGVGGGDGSGGGGDDDDYAFNDGEGEGEDGEGGRGESFFKTVLPELFDRVSLGAVLAEWFKTVAELPLIIRRAVEMGLFSSAQLTRFLAMDVRPNVVRNVARKLPDSWQSQFVGRLMADPGFAHKLVLESLVAAASSLWYEAQVRGERFRSELDLVAINTLGVAGAAAASLWLVAPSRSYGALHKFPWQQMLHKLPNCVFDSSGPLRTYTRQARLGGWVAKMGELAGVGAVTGALTALLAQAAVEARRRLPGGDPNWEPSVAVPNAMHSSAGMAAFFALNAHTRYQLVGGLDKYLFDHSNSLLTYLGITTVARVVSNRIGEASRPACQGLPDTGLAALRAAQRRRAAAAATAAPVRRVRRVPRTAAAAAAAAAAAPVVSDPAAAVATEQQQPQVEGVSGSGAVDAAPAVASTSGQPERVVLVPAEVEQEAFGLAAGPRSDGGEAAAASGDAASTAQADALAAELAAEVRARKAVAAEEQEAVPAGGKRRKRRALAQLAGAQ